MRYSLLDFAKLLKEVVKSDKNVEEMVELIIKDRDRIKDKVVEVDKVEAVNEDCK